MSYLRKILKVIYKSLVALFLTLLCFLLATGVYIYNYQEQIIAKALQATASQLSYSIQAEQIKLSFLKDFPRLSLVLQDVAIQDAQQNAKNILVAHKVNCVFNMHDLLQGQYILHELYVEKGTLNLEGQQKQGRDLPQTVANTITNTVANNPPNNAANTITSTAPNTITNTVANTAATTVANTITNTAANTITSTAATTAANTLTKTLVNRAQGYFKQAGSKQVDFNQTHFAFPLHLKKIILNQVKCTYTTSLPSQQYIVHVQHLQVDCNANIKNVSLQVAGTVALQQAKYQAAIYELNMPLSIDVRVQYDFSKQHYSLQPSILREGGHDIHLQGSWSTHMADPFMDVQIHADRLTIPHILSWLPLSYRQRISNYQLQGNLMCQIHLTKKPNQDLATTTSFKFDQGTILPSGFMQPIQLECMTGRIAIPNFHALELASLEVDTYRARWGDSHFTGHMKIININKLWVQNHSNVIIDLPSLALALHPATNIHLQGQLVGELEVEGSLHDLLQKADKRSFPKLKGQFDSRNIQFVYNQHLFQLQDASSLLLENEELHCKALAGQIEGKSFVLTGKLTNWPRFWLNGEDRLYFDAKLYAEHIELSNLLLADKLLLSDDPDTTAVNYLPIPPCLAGELTCDIEEIVYKRFRGDKLRGKLKIHDQQLIADAVELKFAGGKSCLSGTICTAPDRIQIQTHASLHNVALPTLFDAFENFHQDFLESKHLDGRIGSEIDLTMQADKNFRIDPNSVVANISIQLDQGILQNFEPLQRLAPYVSEKELKRLHFSSLKNDLHIQDKTIYIPPMEVHTSVTSIQLSGTHTFDGKINYKLIVPLQQGTSKEIRRQLPEINEEALAGFNLYLKLEGDIHDYHLSYDHALFKANLKESLKKQGAILEEILQGRGITKRAKELSKDEYFDFE